LNLSKPIDVFLIILATIGSIGAGTTAPIGQLLIGSIISDFGQNMYSNDTNSQFQNVIASTVRSFLIVGVIAFISYALMTSLWLLISQRQIRRMKEQYFHLIMQQEQAWFDFNNAFEISTRVNAQIKQVENGIGEKLGTLIMSASQIISRINNRLYNFMGNYPSCFQRRISPRNFRSCNEYHHRKRDFRI